MNNFARTGTFLIRREGSVDDTLAIMQAMQTHSISIDSGEMQRRVTQDSDETGNTTINSQPRKAGRLPHLVACSFI